ncbi:MAG: PstS family phosphate ABC transporter substrate-binding protein [Oligoflexia bacterium]|nr:PstS family phosphate ABC transporter substrate-binding protein [Oligoflexia bacterium]
MSAKHLYSIPLLLLTAALSLPFAAHADKLISIDGSSTVYPITEAVAEEFQNSNGGAVKVTVGISGTGGGFKKFTRGEIDISDASRPISAEELAQAHQNQIEFIELPIAFDALTVMVNPKNDWVDYLTVAELKKIWEPDAQGKITKWSQVRNGWPDTPIKLYGAGSDSGTFDYFTEAIVGKAKSSRGDYTASEDDNVLVQGIKNDKNALGYFGYAYYAENQDALKAVPIVASGKDANLANAVSPSPETVKAGTYHPLARPIFIYVNKKSLGREEVRNFVEFYLKSSAALTAEVKYVPLPEAAYEKALARLQNGFSGTAFSGHADVAINIDEMFKRELKNGA